MTSSSSAPAAPARPPRCCWPARDTGSCWSTGPRFPSDTVSTHLIHPPGIAALRPLGPARPAGGHRLPADRQLLLRLRPGPRSQGARPGTSRTGRAGPCWTRCSSTRPPRRAPRCGRASPSTSCSSRTARVTGDPAAAAAPSGPAWSSAPTAGTRWSPARSARSSTTRSRRCWPATTPTGAGCRSRPVRDLRPAEDRGVRGLADQRRPDAASSVAGRTPSSRPTGRTSRATSSPRSTWRRRSRERVKAARRESRFAGASVPNYFRNPYGPGWALVGDAGYSRDFITAQGMQRRVPGRRALRERAARGARPAPGRTRSRWRTTRARRDAAVAADVRVHHRARDAGAAARPSWPRCSGPCRATSRRWTASAGWPPGVDSPRRVLRRVERRRDPGPRRRQGRENRVTPAGHWQAWVTSTSHVSGTLPDGRVLLDDVSFRIGEGARAALVGENGAGKTTLLRIIAGDLAPEAGLGRPHRRARRHAPVHRLGARRHHRAALPASTSPRPPSGEAWDAMEAAELALMETDDEPPRWRYAHALAHWGDVGGYDAEVTWDTVTVAALGVPYDGCKYRELSHAVRRRAEAAGAGGAAARAGRGAAARRAGQLPRRARASGGWRSGCSRRRKTVLFVSHDRELLARVADRVVTVEGGRRLGARRRVRQLPRGPDGAARAAGRAAAALGRGARSG